MGWASGLQAGLQLGRAFKEGQERRAMEKIQQEAPTESEGYTETQGRQLEDLAKSGGYDIVPQYAPAAEGQTQGLFTGYQAVPKANLQDQASWDMPAAAQTIAPQRVTDFLGQRYEGGLAPDRVEALRTRAMANAISDPRLRQQMLSEATRAEREAQEAPLRLEGLKQQVKLGGQQLETGELTLEEKRQQADANKRSLAFTNYAAANPDMPIKDLKDAAFKEFKFSPKQWQETVATRLQIDTAEMDIFKNNVKKKLQGKNLTQLGTLYNSDPDFDDKTDLAIVPGKGGAVTLNFIDKATNKITSTQTFKNEAMATEYLNKQATEPETIGSWMMNLAKVEAAIDASAASATKDRAIGAAYGIEKTKPFDPEKYAKTVKAFTDSGMSLVDARVQADQMYGRGPKDTVDADLQEQNKNKGKPTTATDKKTTPEMSQAQARLQIFDDTIARLRQNTGLANPNRAQNAAALAILEQQRAELRDSLRIGGTYNEDVGLRTMPMARP